MITKIKSGSTVFVPDLHAPHHDQRAVNTLIEFIRYFKPEHLIFLGDGFDFYQLSRFDKHPSRLLKLGDDIKDGIDCIKSICDAAPKAIKTMVEGNHERRLYKYLCGHPELTGLDVLAPENLLGLSELGIRWVPEEEVFEHHGFVVTHGTRVSKHSGMSAKSELEKWGVSGISGHTHRIGRYNLSNYGGDHVWFEAGCLCQLNPCYVVGRPNWQHGFAVGDFYEDRFQINQIYIDRDYRVLWKDRIIDGQAM